MAVYKISYVVSNSDHPGAIVNMDRSPRLGERVMLGNDRFEVTEVMDLIPPRGEFHYIHATCKLLEPKRGNDVA